MEYVIGPILGLLISLKFTDYKDKLVKKSVGNTLARTIALQEQIAKVDEKLGNLTRLRQTDSREVYGDIEEIKSAVAELKTNIDQVDSQVLKKSLQIIKPLAAATQRLQDAVGVK